MVANDDVDCSSLGRMYKGDAEESDTYTEYFVETGEEDESDVPQIVSLEMGGI